MKEERIQKMTEQKKDMASKMLNPFFEKILYSVLEKMEQSTALYPEVVITWSSTDENQLKLTCGKDTSTLPIESLPYDDAMLYAEDIVSSGKLKRFSINMDEHNAKHFNAETDEMEVIYKKIVSHIRLNSLF